MITSLPARLRARRLGVAADWTRLDGALRIGRVLGAPNRIGLAAASIEIHTARRHGRDVDWPAVSMAVRRAALRGGPAHRRVA
jgi:hypothetical protein